MNNFLIATKNKNKLKEFQDILRDFSFNILSYNDLGVDLEVDETGETFEENSLLKAMKAYESFNYSVIADDSGLEVDYLGKRPGVRSARYGGVDLTDKDRNEQLLKELDNIPFEKRTGRFVCAITVLINREKYYTVRGEVEGFITLKPIGENGFGYDPIFFIPEYNKTMAELNPDEKNLISHRGIGLKKMIDRLREDYENISN